MHYAKQVWLVILSYVLCGDWCHRQCSGVISCVSYVMILLTICAIGTKQWNQRLGNNDVGNESIQCINLFYNLMDMTGARDGAEASSVLSTLRVASNFYFHIFHPSMTMPYECTCIFFATQLICYTYSPIFKWIMNTIRHASFMEVYGSPIITMKVYDKCIYKLLLPCNCHTHIDVASKCLVKTELPLVGHALSCWSAYSLQNITTIIKRIMIKEA